jgi:hypothetical protein
VRGGQAFERRRSHRLGDEDACHGKRSVRPAAFPPCPDWRTLCSTAWLQ